jgi:hypothetical protein
VTHSKSCDNPSNCANFFHRERKIGVCRSNTRSL